MALSRSFTQPKQALDHPSTITPVQSPMHEKMHPKIQQLIDHYKLETLPVEGTLFASTYVSSIKTTDGNPIGTAIIGLYANDLNSYSSFHRLQHDELWHFYAGDPLRLVLLHPDGSNEDVILGPDFAAGQQVQFTVPAHSWQAGHTLESGYSLFGCTMAPGFTGACFEGGEINALLEQYPSRTADIRRLCSTHGETRMPEGYTQ
jgi:predicted cupin superfamily sugar epimerase